MLFLSIFTHVSLDFLPTNLASSVLFNRGSISYSSRGPNNCSVKKKKVELSGLKILESELCLPLKHISALKHFKQKNIFFFRYQK